MFKMQRVRRGVFFTLLLAAAPAQAAEPLSMLLLDMLREQMVQGAAEPPADGPPAAAPPTSAALHGVYGVSAAQLRGLIDAGFVHLTQQQRDEVYSSLTRMMADPKNAHARRLIIQELAGKAAAVRGTHERLSALTMAEKQAIAADARTEYERLPPDERVQLLQLLQSRVTPIPHDLNELVLAEFTAARSAAESATDPSPQ